VTTTSTHDGAIANPGEQINVDAATAENIRSNMRAAERTGRHRSGFVTIEAEDLDPDGPEILEQVLWTPQQAWSAGLDHRFGWWTWRIWTAPGGRQVAEETLRWHPNPAGAAHLWGYNAGGRDTPSGQAVQIVLNRGAHEHG
jgi:hypothetical protein